MTIGRRPRSARGTGAALRAEILQAARDLLAHTGNADAVSIREVSRRVGVSAPSIYRHFADKDALIEAVVAQVFENLDAAMAAAIDPAASPIMRMRDQGLAYVRFALDHPEQYRIATAASSRHRASAVDQVLGSAVFQRFSQTIREAMDSGLIAPGDPLPVVLQMWASAHGIVSLMIAKPHLPWGDPEVIADRVLAAACIGRAVLDIMGGDPDPDEAARWLEGIRARGGHRP
ncbi:TetR/AcrR family transcriptional regulator [Nocardia sp. CDC159]|uniref:TetR/AcrR family transcriptional regulator n=1 Tax=Nocardia pulmonis TaxID=2951408 RepID=A0A9X2E4E8_9NOCA|nr:MULTISPECIES: TetR/AcrR family transcriptional regulator [Nocardia]MCM6772635.1 TetR/AcrR family transcriptional regulator [Nocardia pulmonis]MCM6786062.1 TetR/AcrR family transcriptional regulator [Nocardia sp. CDC159]